MENYPDFTSHFHLKNGFCYPDWDAVQNEIEKALPPDHWQAAWTRVGRLWLEAQCLRLGSHYRVFETSRFLILTEAPQSVTDQAGKAFERSLSMILQNLAGAASDEGWGKHVVLMFIGVDDYYDYIAEYYDDGEYPMSGGVCLSGNGYVHFALMLTEYYSYIGVLVHELTHGCLAHLQLPTWLNEALAMRMEEFASGTNSGYFDSEVHDKHLSFWNRDTIQDFWSGTCWRNADDGFELSYSLASLLWRKIEIGLNPSQPTIIDFINESTANDAGEAACEKHFGMGLGTLAASYLGPGDWSPKPESWVERK